jgi:hypothetical protein
MINSKEFVNEDESTCSYFSKRITFQGTFKSNLWPRHKLGCHYELIMEHFLPYIHLPPIFLSKVYQCLCSDKEYNSVIHEFNNSEILCMDVGNCIINNPEIGRLFMNGVLHPNTGLQITKAEMYSLCRELRESISNHKGLKDYLELNIEPSISDYIKIAYSFSATNNKLIGKVLAIAPNICITLEQIKGFSAASNELTMRLLGRDEREFQSGFITLDQGHRLVVLDPSDPKTRTYPLIGIWTTGLFINSEETTKNSKLMAAILRFLFSEEIKLRVSTRTKSAHTFLLVNFPGHTIPQFFEFKLSDTGTKSNWMLLESSFSVSRFDPINLQMSFKEKHGSFNVYKLSHVLSSLEDSFIDSPLNVNTTIHRKTKQHEEPEFPDYGGYREFVYEGSTLGDNYCQHAFAEESSIHKVSDEVDMSCMRSYIGDYPVPSCSTSASAVISSDTNFSPVDTEAQLMQVVIENNKSIQTMQQYVAELTKQMAELSTSFSIEKCSSIQQNNSLHSWNSLIAGDTSSPKRASFTADESKIEVKSTVESDHTYTKDENKLNASEEQDKSIHVPKIIVPVDTTLYSEHDSEYHSHEYLAKEFNASNQSEHGDHKQYTDVSVLTD